MKEIRIDTINSNGTLDGTREMLNDFVNHLNDVYTDGNIVTKISCVLIVDDHAAVEALAKAMADKMKDVHYDFNHEEDPAKLQKAAITQVLNHYAENGFKSGDDWFMFVKFVTNFIVSYSYPEDSKERKSSVTIFEPDRICDELKVIGLDYELRAPEEGRNARVIRLTPVDKFMRDWYDMGWIIHGGANAQKFYNGFQQALTIMNPDGIDLKSHRNADGAYDSFSIRDILEELKSIYRLRVHRPYPSSALQFRVSREEDI